MSAPSGHKSHLLQTSSLRLRVLLGILLLFPLIEPSSLYAVARQADQAPTAAADFIVAMGEDVITLDPALANDTPSLLLAVQIYDTLVKYSPGGSVILPGLAESWTRNSDATQWTFTLRSGVTFHDGSALDGAAVLANFNRWWDPDDPAHIGIFDYFATFFGGFKGEDDCIIESMSAPDANHFQINFKQPTYHLLALVSFPAFSIASPLSILSGDLETQPVGTGPFIFISWTPGEQIDLNANPSYWNGAPLLDSLAFRVIPLAEDRLLALVAGSVHSVTDPFDDQLQALADDPAYQVLWRPSGGVGYMGINRAHTPLNNLLVRQAIAHAVDWQALANTYYNAGDLLANQFLPSSVWGTNPLLNAPTYDPSLAQSLLTAAGYPSFSTTLSYRSIYRPYLPDAAGTAVAIKDYLEAVNITVTVTEYDSATFLGKVYAGELDLYLLGWYADFLHPQNFYEPHLCNPGNLSFGAFDPVFCTDLQNALEEPDFQQQVMAYQSIALDVANSLPLIPMIHPRWGLLTLSNITGLVASPLSLEEYHSVAFSDAVQTSVDPTTSATLTYTDPLAEPTTIEIPTGAVIETVIMRLEPTTLASLPSDFASAGHAFTLEAIQDGDVLQGFTFETPVTVTIEYSDADVASIKEEETLKLNYWDGSAWVDAATTCDPVSPYTRNLEENWLSVDICHLSLFSLAGENWLDVFIPIVYH